MRQILSSNAKILYTMLARCWLYSALGFTIFSLQSCLEIPKVWKEEKLDIKTDFNTVKINDYSLSVPKYMKVATDLNADASLQYQHVFKEAYAVVIDEPKEELISVFKELDEWDEAKSVSENYRDIQLQFIEESMRIDNQSPAKSIEVNGLEAQRVEVIGNVPGISEDIAYHFTFINGTDNVYMIMMWTLASEKEKLWNTYEQMADSFSLL